MSENVIIDIANEEVERQLKHLRPNELIELSERDGFLHIKAKHVFYDRDGGIAVSRVEMCFDAHLVDAACAGMVIGEDIRRMIFRLRSEEVGDE